MCELTVVSATLKADTECHDSKWTTDSSIHGELVKKCELPGSFSDLRDPNLHSNKILGCSMNIKMWKVLILKEGRLRRWFSR